MDNSDAGVKRPYYVRDYLSPRHIKEHGLAEILEAMEFADHNNDNHKKQLLGYLWPDTSRNFAAIFQPFKRQKPGPQTDDDNQGLRLSLLYYYNHLTASFPGQPG